MGSKGKKEVQAEVTEETGWERMRTRKHVTTGCPPKPFTPFCYSTRTSHSSWVLAHWDGLHSIASLAGKCGQYVSTNYMCTDGMCATSTCALTTPPPPCLHPDPREPPWTKEIRTRMTPGMVKQQDRTGVGPWLMWKNSRQPWNIPRLLRKRCINFCLDWGHIN